MAEKLKFLLTDRTLWKLALKSIVAATALFLVRFFNFHFIAILGFFVLLLIIYFSQAGERKLLRLSFWVLPALSLAAIGLISPINLIGLIGFIFVFAILFFIILGLVDFFFKERALVYGIFNTALFLILFLLFFYLTPLKNFWILGIALFFLIILIFGEIFKFFEMPKTKRTFALAAAASLLGVEFSWITGLLPLGFINSAVFLTLFFLLTRDAFIASVRGNLNFSFVFRELLFFVFITIIIFAAASWSV